MGGGSGMTCWRRLRDWQQAGVWQRLHQVLLQRLQDAGRIDWERASLDSASVPAPGGGEQIGPNPTDRAKSGSKRHIVVDRNGIPLAVTQSAANVHASRMVEATVVAIPPLRLRGGRRHGRSEPWRADLRGAAGGADPRRRSALAGGGLSGYVT